MKPKTILLIEDEEIVRDCISQTLQVYGYFVIEASETSEAFNLYSDTSAIDLVLTDISLPPSGGANLSDLLKKIEGKTSVIFMSGNTDEMTKIAAAFGNGFRFISKPFGPETLINAVRSTLAE